MPSILVSIVVSIPACHAGDRGSIPRRGVYLFTHQTTFLQSMDGHRRVMSMTSIFNYVIHIVYIVVHSLNTYKSPKF